jgi:PhnB protein
MPAQLNAHLNFNGRCREAMTFYQQCLGGELNMQKIAESPMAAQMSSEAGANILHSTLIRNGVLLMMGSDRMDVDLQRGNSVVLCLNCSSDEEINTFFRNLSAGGQVRLPLHQTFRGSTYGELIDKFGVLWMINYTKN